MYEQVLQRLETLGDNLSALKRKPSTAQESAACNWRLLRRAMCERLLIYAVFHPTIKIMDDDIDLAGAMAMTGLGLSGWKEERI